MLSGSFSASVLVRSGLPISAPKAATGPASTFEACRLWPEFGLTRKYKRVSVCHR